MTEFLLIRHAVNDFVKTGKLAGWTPGVHLNDEGKLQAAALGTRLKETRIDAIYASPLERCQETAGAVLEYHPELTLQTLEGIGEVRFGDWQGAELSKLSRRKAWGMVQAFPSRHQFPNGESMRGAQMRAVDAIEALAAKHPRQRIAVVSHSDVIKMILAHYLGMHLDMFQRINVSPASLSVLSFGYMHVMVGQINETTYLPKPAKSDGRKIELAGVTSIIVDTVGEPGSRVFYLQIDSQSADRESNLITLAIEKTQAMIIADEADRLLGEYSTAGELPSAELRVPETTLFRAGKIALQYEEAKPDQVQLMITELVGADQGTPRTLTAWLTKDQVRALGSQARLTVNRGRV